MHFKAQKGLVQQPNRPDLKILYQSTIQRTPVAPPKDNKKGVNRESKVEKNSAILSADS
jgi:hypothetical protein